MPDRKPAAGRKWLTAAKAAVRMTQYIQVLIAAALCLGLHVSSVSAAAIGLEPRAALVEKLCAEQAAPRLDATETILKRAAADGDDAVWGRAIVHAYGNKLYLCGNGRAVVREGERYLDAASLAALDEKPEGLSAPFVNLKVRASLDIADDLLSLLTDPAGPLAEKAIAALEKSPKLAEPASLEAAIRLQKDPAFKARLEGVRGVRLLSDPDPENRLKAITLVAAKPSQQNLTTLVNLAADPAYAADPRIKAALDYGTSSIRSWLRAGDILSVLFSGLSYASILFLASLGLAIIFGLIGVINLAQGELIMVGAYATYFVQEALRVIAPGLLEFYIILAIPFAFLLSAAVGLAMEVTVIRHLYRRPLITLLATWAVSLLLINSVRVAFGTQNLEFITPAYLAGGERILGDFIITWNRLFAILCALATFFLALFLLKSTRLGLYIRAVTANRDMAGCIGGSTRRVDLLSFAIGSGLAGGGRPL